MKQLALIVALAAPAFGETAVATARQSVRPDSWSLLARASDSDGLGYDRAGAGIALWREHCGTKLCVFTEATATTASKVDGSSSYGAVLLAEERLSLGKEWWIGAGTEWTWVNSGEPWADRFTVSAGWSDDASDGNGQAVVLRILGPDSTEYRTHGVLVRWEGHYPRALLAIEVSELAFTAAGDDEWGRRATVYYGWRWR